MDYISENEKNCSDTKQINKKLFLGLDGYTKGNTDKKKKKPSSEPICDDFFVKDIDILASNFDMQRPKVPARIITKVENTLADLDNKHGHRRV